MLELRASNEDIVQPFAEEFNSAVFVKDKHPWEVKCDIAIPCATQNELNEEDASKLIENKCICVCEGANMPCTPEAIELIRQNDLLFGPGKAANAGGVATSGLEMSQNSMKLTWTKDEVDSRLHQIMSAIHETCVKHGKNRTEQSIMLKGQTLPDF